MELTNGIYITIFIVGILIGGVAGVTIGSSYALDSCVSVGVKILNTAGVKMLINQEKIGELILRYQNQVG